MGINDGGLNELHREFLRGNPTIGNTNPVTICRGTTIVGSYYMDIQYDGVNGVTWRQTFYTDNSSNVVAITAVTTV